MEALVRKSRQGEWQVIKSLLKDMGLYMDHYESSSREANFWVAESSGEIVAVAQTESAGDADVLSSVGVKPEKRGNRIASRLIMKILDHASSDLYLYTLIPDFFRGFGFVEAVPPQSVKDYRSNYDCDACKTDACVCMVRRQNVS